MSCVVRHVRSAVCIGLVFSGFFGLNAEAQKFGLQVASATSSSLHDTDSPDHSFQNETLGVVSSKFDFGLTLSALFGGVKDLKGEKEFKWHDIYLGATQNVYQPTEGVQFKALGRIYFPTSEKSREDEELKNRFMIAAQANLDMDPLVGLTGLKLTYRPYVNIYNHELQVARSGASNTMWSLSHRGIITYAFTDSLGVTLDSIYARAYKYSGKAKDTFSFDQAIGYSFLEYFEISIGHNIGGSALSTNGRDSAVDLFDKRRSSVYVEAAMSI